MNKYFPYSIILMLPAIVLQGENAYGQRINFSTWAGSSSITIQPVSGNNALDFGKIFIGQAKTILLSGNEVTAFDITAERGYDLTVSVSAPPVLDGPDSKTIPFRINFAYSDQGAQVLSVAKTSATEVPAGFTSVTFPVLRYASGLPAPPPAPLDGATTSRPTAKSWLFIYGNVGPAASDASAGNYTGTINITVDYTSY